MRTIGLLAVLLAVAGTAAAARVSLVATHDLELRSNQAGVNYNTLTRFGAGAYFNSMGFIRSAVRFDLSSIPPGVAVSNCSLMFYCQYVQDTTQQHDYMVKRIVSLPGGQWDEALADWNTFFGTIPGTYAEVDTILAGGQYQWWTWDNAQVTALVQDWVNNPTQNLGLMLWKLQEDSRNDRAYFRSSEYADPAQKPVLVVHYPQSTGVEITGVTRDIQYPYNSDTVNVWATITPPTGGTLDITRLQYSVDGGGSWNELDTNHTAAPNLYYFVRIPTLSFDSVLYRIYAHSVGVVAEAYSDTFMYRVPLNKSIPEIQGTGAVSPYRGKYVHTAGVVTGMAGQQRVYIGTRTGGPWSGLQVYRSVAETVALRLATGDSIDVAGLIGEFYGTTQESLVWRQERSGVGKPYDTTTVSMADSKLEDYEGVLLRVDTVILRQQSGVFAGNTSYWLINLGATDSTVVYPFLNTPIVTPPQPIPLGYQTLVCNAGEYNGTHELHPGEIWDFSFIAPDVRLAGVTTPPDTIVLGEPCVPAVNVENLSTINTAANFTTRFTIAPAGGGAPVFNVQSSPMSVGPGVTQPVTFGTWTQYNGDFTVQTYTEYGSDPNKQNDTVTQALYVRTRDVGATSVLLPADTAFFNIPVTPRVHIVNVGSIDATFDLQVVITGPGGTEYDHTATGVWLAAGTQADYDMADVWVPAGTGAYTVTATTSVAYDNDPSNNTASHGVLVLNGPVVTSLIQPSDNARLNTPTPDFEWSAAGGANWYELQVATDAGFTAPCSVDVQQAGSTYTPASALADGHYYWRVRASANSGTNWGDYTPDPFEFDLDATPPAAVALVNPGPNAANVPLDVTFSWVAPEFDRAPSKVRKTVSGRDVIDYYDLEVALDRTFTNRVVTATPTGTTYQPSPGTLANLTRYYWRVRGVDDFGNEGDWTADSFTTVVQAPGVPTLLYPASGAVNVLMNGDLIWAAGARADAYDVYLDDVNPPVTTLATGVTVLFQAYTGLLPNAAYFWKVVAHNAGGLAESDVWAFTTGTGYAAGWYPKDSMPSPQVKDGGAMCYSGDVGRIYAIKGNKTDDFYQYTPTDSTWKKLASVTAGDKAVGKGAAITTGAGFVFVMKGNNTRDFYKFDIAESTWIKAKDIPLALDQTATRGKAVKAGGSLAYVNKDDTAEYVYTLKGYGTDFYKYDIARDTFYSLTAAPYTSKPKYDKGSWICYDGTQYIYVMQAKYNALYRYDVRGEQWDVTVLKGMPLNSTVTGKTNKKAGDGGCAAWNPDGSYLFAMKGNGTQEAWKYVPGADGDSWTEVESIPQAYATGAKKKKVKSGGAAAYYPETGVFYVQKGNKSNQFWMYVPGAAAFYAARPQRDGVSAGDVTSVAYRLAVCPNPLASGYATIRYSLPKAGTATLSVNDVTGRVVMTRTLVASRTGAAGLDLRGLSAGVYLVKLTADGCTTSQKLVVER